MATVQKTKKFVAFFDTHIGCEWTFKKGKKFKQRTENMGAINAALLFVRDFQPDFFLFGGDQINCGPVSRWNNNKPRKIEDLKLKDELDYFDDRVLSRVEASLARGARQVWMDGNHEDWIEQLLDSTPGLEGMVEPRNYLDLEKRGWELYSPGELATLGKLHFMHGDGLKGKYPANTAVTRYRRNVRFGHFHTFMGAPDHSPLDALDIHTAIGVPCLANRGPDYGKGAPNQCMNGFNYGYVEPNGDFTDYVVIMNNNSFIVEGMRYGG